MIIDELIKEIRKDLRSRHPNLFQKAFTDSEAREELKELLVAEHGEILDDEEKVNYVIQELVGLGFIERLIEDERVTDIGFNGTDLIIEGNGIEKYRFDSEDITEDRIIKTIAKFSNVTGHELSPKNPILNTSMNFLRLNAAHNEYAPDGTTMAIRVARPQMKLTEENWEEFAPRYMLDFCKAAVKTRSNIMIAGATGAGKTEFQKLLMSFIPFSERIALIQSTIEIYAKHQYPDKDIFSWLATEDHPVEEWIELAAKRSHPVWIIIQEIIGKEAFRMLLSILSDHRIITTLHAIDAEAIPQSLLEMAKIGYKVDEESFLDNFYRYVDFGFYLKRRKNRRYLAEVVEYQPDHTARLVFKQVWTKEGLKPIVGSLSDDFMNKLIEFDCDYEGLPQPQATG